MEETGGQISNVGQQVDGSSDAEESQRLVSFIFCDKLSLMCNSNIIYNL